MTIEVVDVPIKKWWIFPQLCNSHYQMVHPIKSHQITIKSPLNHHFPRVFLGLQGSTARSFPGRQGGHGLGPGESRAAAAAADAPLPGPGQGDVEDTAGWPRMAGEPGVKVAESRVIWGKYI